MKYGFIGCGNMGGALARAVAAVTPDIMLCDRNTEKANALAEKLGVCTGTDTDVAEACDRIFLGVKPQVMRSAIAEISSKLREKKPLLITMAAGIEIKTLEEMIGASVPIIRIMPNTPVEVGKGLVLYCANALVTDRMLNDFLEDMRFAGKTVSLNENLIDAGCALSGCGPAFVYMFIEALADGAVSCGLPRSNATEFAAQTLIGSAEMVLRSGKHPGELKDNVCSPGGSTICGVKALEDGGFRSAVINAVVESFKKNMKLGND